MTRARRPGAGGNGGADGPVTSLPVPPAGRHGGDGAAVAAALGLDPDDVLDLSASLNPVAPDPTPAVMQAVRAGALGRYPDPSRARRALAAAMEVDPEGLLLTNGGAEAISLLTGAIGGRVEEPEFSLHPRGGPGEPRWRSNPHNPTGRLSGPDDRAGVWDEAFYPLATGRWTRGDADTPVVGSLTKLLACPGLRIGYVLADPSLIRRLSERQTAWSVNTMAAEALPRLLDGADLAGWAAAMARLRAELTTLLDRHGLEPSPSDANWVLCARAAGLRERLAGHGVVVRDCASFGLVGQARVAVPGPDGLARLARALERSAP